MKWKGRRRSTNVEDQRGMRSSARSGRRISPAMARPLMKFLFSKTGLVIVGIFLVVSFLTGNNPLTLISQLLSGGAQPTVTENYQPSAENEELAQFSTVILADTEDIWNQMLDDYREPTLVLFTENVSSACGHATAATGPFYCSGDEKLYIDLSFFEEMEEKLDAPGDFAQAYVIAHEVGHHIQNLAGTIQKVHSLKGRVSEKEFNEASVRLELQADFLAGVWAHHSQKISRMMEEGDLEEALNAANAIGDDRLQKKFQGRVVPDSFTHGTSAQRKRWFKLGFETGDLSKGDTFSATEL